MQDLQGNTLFHFILRKRGGGGLFQGACFQGGVWSNGYGTRGLLFTKIHCPSPPVVFLILGQGVVEKFRRVIEQMLMVVGGRSNCGEGVCQRRLKVTF